MGRNEQRSKNETKQNKKQKQTNETNKQTKNPSRFRNNTISVLV
jgi:hypothetical protein